MSAIVSRPNVFQLGSNDIEALIRAPTVVHQKPVTPGQQPINSLGAGTHL